MSALQSAMYTDSTPESNQILLDAMDIIGGEDDKAIYVQELVGYLEEDTTGDIKTVVVNVLSEKTRFPEQVLDVILAMSSAIN